VRVLLVEDDPMVGEAIRTGLGDLGFTVDWVREGVAALSAASTEPFAAVVLDLQLPRKDGLSVLRELRERKLLLPVLIITARDQVKDRVAGLDAGADDYIVKPFDMQELAARLRAVLRRHAGSATPLLQARGITLDPATREVRSNGQLVALSAREIELLELLMQRPGMPLSRAQIEDRLLRWGDEVTSNTIEVHIHNLRKKLGMQAIRNIRGVGYFVPRE
jgi:two-component system, OmpR family, response regulator QseB